MIEWETRQKLNSGRMCSTDLGNKLRVAGVKDKDTKRVILGGPPCSSQPHLCEVAAVLNPFNRSGDLLPRPLWVSLLIKGWITTLWSSLSSLCFALHILATWAPLNLQLCFLNLERWLLCACPPHNVAWKLFWQWAGTHFSLEITVPSCCYQTRLCKVNLLWWRRVQRLLQAPSKESKAASA